MRILYFALLYLSAPLVMIRLLWRSRNLPDYRRRWGERFGFYGAPPPAGGIWLHAVSVGEVQAAVPLLRELLQRHPDHSVLVTTTTPTGSTRVRDLFGGKVHHVYLPYDLPDAVGRFLDWARPSLGLVMETELWPNLFRACARRGIPLLIANARLSPRSFRGYRRLRRLVRATLADVTRIAAQSETDAARFRALGADPERVVVTGSIKFDLRLPASLREQAEVLRRALGSHRAVWIAASTHEGEEEAILAALDEVRDLASALLILVPRHPDRFDRVAALCQRRGLPVARRSRDGEVTAETRVYLGDTLGELPLLYAAADVAFVGGSLVPVGGHNVLEPAALGVPVLFGPYHFNFPEIAPMLIEAGGAVEVADARHLVAQVADLLRDPNRAHQMGEAGLALVEANRGALGRLLEQIEEVMAVRQ
ncbi:MAG TPA: 3-deoxy-D-manno-octulosonic acid transferase [Thiotrichales bacterium]|nr:3-deoxy-D-manno-octulosonic acid transferase [Thiotrichales bacterium]